MGRGVRRLCAGFFGGVLACVAVQLASTTDATAQSSVPSRAHHSGPSSPQTSRPAAAHTSAQGSAHGSDRGVAQSAGLSRSVRRAHSTSSVSGQVSCQADGTYSVTWYVTNGDGPARTVSVSGHRPRIGSVSPSTQTIGGGSSGSFTQSGVAGTQTSASLSLRTSNSHGRGGQLSASVSTDGRCRAKHSPGRPVPTNGACASGAAMNPSVRIPADSAVTYYLDGARTAPGAVPVSDGTHQVTVRSSRFVLDRTVFTFTVSAARNCTTATLGSPHVNAPPCITGGGQPSDFTTSLPNGSGVAYSASPAVRTASGWAVTVNAVATHGRRLGQTASSGWHIVDGTRATTTLAVPSPLSCVQATAPSFAAGSCVNGNLSAPSATLAATHGVAYFADGQQLVPGTHPVAAGATVNIISQARPGYLLTGSSSFTHAFAATPVCAGVRMDPQSGVALGADVTLPLGVTVGATVRTSVGGVPAGVLSNAPGCGANCLGPIIPPSAAFHDDHCVTSSGQRSGASFTIPSVTGAIYWVNGSAVRAGTYPAVDGMTVTIVTSPRTGYSLSGITQWTHTFPDAPSCSGISAKDKTASTTPTGKANSGQRQDSAAAPNNTSTSNPAFSGTPVAQLLLIGTALLLIGGAACFAGGAVRGRWLPIALPGVPNPLRLGPVEPHPDPARSQAYRGRDRRHFPRRHPHLWSSERDTGGWPRVAP